MKILRIDPGLYPQEAEINGSLESMQQLVGGLIQVLYPFRDAEVALICNDEGKLLGLPFNRALRDERGATYDVVAGTFFLCSASWDSDTFGSLSEDQVQEYMERFRHPELFIKIGEEILCLPAD